MLSVVEEAGQGCPRGACLSQGSRKSVGFKTGIGTGRRRQDFSAKWGVDLQHIWYTMPRRMKVPRKWVPKTRS